MTQVEHRHQVSIVLQLRQVELGQVGILPVGFFMSQTGVLRVRGGPYVAEVLRERTLPEAVTNDRLA